MLGRKFEDGRCWLKLKDTAGQDCGSKYHPKWQCYGGVLWIDLQTLGKNAIDIIYIPLLKMTH
jgi:hypothetical protein